MRSRVASTAALLLLASLPVAADTLKVPSAAFPSLAAATAAAAPGDTISVAKGVYTENVTLTVDQVTLKGKGAILDARGGTALQVEADEVTISGFSIRNALDGIVVEGDGATIFKNKVEGAAGNGIEVLGDEARIERNDVSQCGAIGILYLSESNRGPSFIEKNVVRLCAGRGIELFSAQVSVQYNRVEMNRNDGIFYDEAFAPKLPSAIAFNKVICNGENGIRGFLVPGGLVIGGNLIQQNGEDGVLVESGSGVLVLENRVSLNGGAGIHLSSDTNTVNENRVQQNGDAGILLDENFLGVNTVFGNVCTNNGRDGIELQGPDNLIQENVCDKNRGDGIDLDAPTGGNSLLGNRCKSNFHEGIDNSGIATILQGNTATKNGSRGSLDGVDDIPDFAGAGNGGVGSVDLGQFLDNLFGSGEATTSQVLDL